LEENVKSSLQKRLHVNITDRIDSSGNREAAAGRPPTIATGEFGGLIVSGCAGMEWVSLVSSDP